MSVERLDPCSHAQDLARLQRYAVHRFGPRARVLAATPLGGDSGGKGFGYGAPIRVTLEGAPVEDLVVHWAETTGFGHDTLADRAAEALLPYDTFNNLPDHVRVLDVGYTDERGDLCSIREAHDFFFVTEFARGEPFWKELDALSRGEKTRVPPVDRAAGLAQWLARVHADRRDAPELYRRRLRDLFGGHECLAGLIDSYSGHDLAGYTSAEELESIERRAVRWRHRLRGHTSRLCRVHGDFHPWNILFDGPHMVLLDRSRGEWGEAADDLAAMAINFLFFSLRAHGRVEEPFRAMWTCFFETYLGETRDEELLTIIPPFLVWRALVVASPVWYPRLDVGVRRALFTAIDNLLDGAALDYERPELLCEVRP